MNFSILISRKTNFIRLIGKRLWAEIAVWPTSRSALQGWQFQRRGILGFLGVTPLFGFSATLYWDVR